MTREFPLQFTQKVTPVSADKLMIADSADDGIVKYITFADVQGPQGVGITWRGAYSGATAYSINDAVSYTNGLSYICILASTGNVPTNATYWAVILDAAVATESSKGPVRLATTTDVTNGTDTESGEPLVVQPSMLKTTNDNLNTEKLKIKSKEDVVVATTANITLSGTQTIDGVAVTAGQRVLVKDQSTASQNGIYLCASGAWTRVVDFDANVNNEVDLGAMVWVQGGTVGIGTAWALTTTGAITVGSTNLTFSKVYPAILSDVSARVTKSGTQAVGAGLTSITWDTETFDTSSFHDNVTNNSRLTIPTTGKYTASANIHTSTGAAFDCNILLNNTTIISSSDGNYRGAGAIGGASLTTGIYQFTAGDYIEVQASQSVTVVTTSSFSIVKAV